MILNETDLDAVCGGHLNNQFNLINLQSLVSQRLKFVEALSHIMQNMDTVQGTVVSNLKG